MTPLSAMCVWCSTVRYSFRLIAVVQFQAHSQVPEAAEDWPSLSEIIDFRDRVRQRLIDLYNQFERGEQQLTRRVGRVLAMTFEHEQIHIEVCD